MVGISEAEDVPIWAELKQFSRTTDASFRLQRICQWDSLKLASIDFFRRSLDQSGEYAAFFIRALIGDKQHIFRWTKDQIEFDRDALDYFATADHDRRLGADLVARAALTAAWEICQRSNKCIYYPCLDRMDLKHPYLTNNNAGMLRFLSADFVRAVKHRIRSYKNKDGNPVTYYDYGWVNGKPPTDGRWESHGWRMNSDRDFVNDPPSNPSSTSNQSIETFLGFPAFFQHEISNIVFCCPVRRDWKLPLLAECNTIGDNSLSELLALGIDPYIAEKQEEFEKRLANSPQLVGSITSCVGVANHRAAFFDPNKFEAGYGVFLTIDVETEITAEKGCGSGNCNLDKEAHLRGIQEALENSRHRLRYKVLQVLAGALASEKEKRNQELEKYQLMYHQLLRPLRNITEAIRQSQTEAHEIAAIIYDPLEVLLGSQPEIAQLFEDGKPVKVPGDSRVNPNHQPGQYKTDTDACGMAAELLRRLVPESASDFPPMDAIKAFQSVLRWYHVQASYQAKPYFLISKALGRFIGEKNWNKRLEAAASNIGAKKEAVEILDSMKACFFTIYKPDEARTALGWKVLRAHLSTIWDWGNDDFLSELPEVFDGQNGLVLLAETNPFSTHGHVVCFIGRIVAQHFSYYKEVGSSAPKLTFVLTDDKHSSKLRVCSTKGWIPDAKDLADFINEQINLRIDEKKANKEYGNLKRPFVDLTSRIPEALLLTAKADIQEESKLCLRWPVGTLTFLFSENEFIITSSVKKS